MLESSIRFSNTRPSCNLHEIAEGQRRPCCACLSTGNAYKPMTTTGEPCVRVPRSLDGHPAPQGLYDPRNEHDACGVGFVADLTGEAEPRARRAGADRPAQPGPPRRRRRRAGLRRRRRHPAPDPGRLPARGRRLRRCPPPAATPSASPSCPRAGRPRQGRRRDRADRRRGGPDRPRLARGARPTPTCSAPTARSVMPRFRAALRRRRRRRRRARHRPGPARLRAAQARRARGRRLLPVAVRAHHRLQGHAHHRPAGAVLPRPVRRAVRHRDRPGALAGSPPTPSRPGRWPTRTASSRTTARSTRSRATATGCGPARRCWPAT